MSIEEELLQSTPLVLLNFYKVVSFRHYAGIIVGTNDKQFAIYGHVSIGQTFQHNHKEQVRPRTHDLLNSMCLGFDIRLLRVVIHDYKQDVFYSRIFFEQKCGEMLRVVDIDARPSDSIFMALFHHAPILCVKSVFDSSVPYCE